MISTKKAMPVGRKYCSLIRLGQRRQVVIPKTICDELGLRHGDFVEVTKSIDHVVIKPQKLAGREDTLTPNEERIVTRGFKQLKRGQYVAWDKLKDELGL